MKPSAVAIMCLIGISCTPVYKTVTMDEYAAGKIMDKTLMMAPFGNIIVDYIGSVEEEFGAGDSRTLILEHFKKKLRQGLSSRSTFSSLIFDSCTMTQHTRRIELDMDDAFNLYVTIPEGDETLLCDTVKPDFILFIQDLYIGTEMLDDNSFWGMKTGAQSGMLCSHTPWNQPLRFSSQQPFSQTLNFQPPYTPPPNQMFFTTPRTPQSKYLRYKCGFVFWDNHNHKVAAYGKIFAKSKAEGYGLGMVQIVRMSHWEDIDNQFIADLLFGTPFEK